MSSSFDRLRAQLFVEQLVGCTELTQWKNYRPSLEAHSLSSTEAADLRSELHKDGSDLFFKSIQCLVESISSFRRRLYSWGTVKAYYSLFYCLRASLAVREKAVIRNGSFYLFEAAGGRTPEKKGGKNYRNDHTAIISIYRELFSSSDPLQSNSLNGEHPYLWLMGKRNQVHYHERVFHDPNPPAFLSHLAEAIETGQFETLLDNYIMDSGLVYPFQPEDAAIALPLRRAIETKDEFSSGAFV